MRVGLEAIVPACRGSRSPPDQTLGACPLEELIERSPSSLGTANSMVDEVLDSLPTPSPADLLSARRSEVPVHPPTGGHLPQKLFSEPVRTNLVALGHSIAAYYD
jgi:hypothetical protein